MRVLMIIPLLVLAACASPQENCLKAATGQLSTVDRLIAETEGNLTRGYALQREAYTTSGVNYCFGRYNGGRTRVGFSYCNSVQTQYRNRPVPIDRTVEQRKLRDLKQTRAKLVKDATPKIAQCQALYGAG